MTSCSDLAMMQKESMIGTAGHYPGYLLLEAAMPWKYDILESKDILHMSPMIREMADSHGFRTLLIGRERGILPGMRYVAWVVLDPQKLTYRIYEYHIPKDREERLLLAIIEQTEDSLPYLLGCTRRLVLVCIDGAHDTCCGVKGYPLFRELQSHFEGSEVVQVKRCSHLGGHRYAPTCVDFPEGRYYGRLPVGKAANIMDKKHAWKDLLPYYRGNGCVPPMEQHIEAYALERDLWNPLSEDSETQNKTSLELLHQHLRVVEDGEVEIIASCGKTETKVQKLYRVEEL